MNRITPGDCKKMMDSNQAVLIDIREPWEVDICSIGGETIPMHKIPELAQNMDKAANYIIMCKTGKRAESVANLLECDYQFQHVAILDGGITAWYCEFDPSKELY
jgi:rhodanese-related sulfurtransferase